MTLIKDTFLVLSGVAGIGVLAWLLYAFLASFLIGGIIFILILLFLVWLIISNREETKRMNEKDKN